METRLINLFQFQTLIASKAVRCVLAAPGKNLVELNIWLDQNERDEFVEKLLAKRSYYDPDSNFIEHNGNRKSTLAFYEIIEIGGRERILSMFYDMSEQKRIMNALHATHKESETLRESLASIVTTFDLTEVVELILDKIKQIIPYDTASVWRVDGEWQKLIVGRDIALSGAINACEKLVVQGM